MRAFNNPGSAIPCPCHKCENRSADCHGFCALYKDFEQKNEAYRNEQHRKAEQAFWAKPNPKKSRY